MKLRWPRKTGNLVTYKLWRRKKRKELLKKRTRSCTHTHGRKLCRLKRINQSRIDLDPTVDALVRVPQLHNNQKRKLIQEYQVRRLKWLSGTVAAIVELLLELAAEVAAVVVLGEIQGELSFLMTFSFCLWNWKISHWYFRKLIRLSTYLLFSAQINTGSLRS